MARIHNINTFEDIARKNNGSCLSKIYKNVHSIIEMKCSEGHVWKTRAGNLVNGTWCPTCARLRSRNDILVLQKIAEERGG